MTPEAAHSEMMPAPTRKLTGRSPMTRNCCTTRSSVPGGTICERKFCSVAETKSARVCTRMAAELASRGKKLSRAE